MIAMPSAPVSVQEDRYTSLCKPGRALTFPCDACGHVDMDTLSERARNNDPFARATVGSKRAMPHVCQPGTSGVRQRR